MPEPLTPEHTKMHAAVKNLHTESIGEFLEWMGEQGIVLCRAPNDEDRDDVSKKFGISLSRIEEIIPVFIPAERCDTQSLLYRYADIDPEKIEDEKQAILDYAREKASQQVAHNIEIEICPACADGPCKEIENAPGVEGSDNAQ